MSQKSSLAGWQKLAAGWPWFRGAGRYPLPGYSEFNPPPRLLRKPYGPFIPPSLAADDPHGWPITEYEEALQLRPGLCETAHELMAALKDLANGEPGEALQSLLQEGNPFWPEELIRHQDGLSHERLVLLMPLALSLTQDDKCRLVWTLFGGSEHGPGRAFWHGFATGPNQDGDEDRPLNFFRRLLHQAFGESNDPQFDPIKAGLRFLPSDPTDFPGWDDGLLPRWAERFLWSPGQTVRGVKYLLTFRPFAALPGGVRKAYREGRLHLLPFPGSLIFWGTRPYHRLQTQLPLALQVPLRMALERHAGLNRLRVPQTGWFIEPGPHLAQVHGPIRNTTRRPHRQAREFWESEDDALDVALSRALFSTKPEHLGLYNKPMARNVQLWTADFRLLLDGPAASPEELAQVGHEVGLGGQFGYRFQYPAMRVGPYELYWHRPLVAFQAGRSGRTTVMEDAPLGYLTAYPADDPDPRKPVVFLWPRLPHREPHATAIALFRQKEGEPVRRVLVNVRKLLEAHELRNNGPLPHSFARRLLTLDRGGSVERWLKDLPAKASDPVRGEQFADTLREIIAPPTTAAGKAKPPESLTFARTARRSFEVAFWKTIAQLSMGRFETKNNGDCCLDPATQAHLKHHRRDLDPLGNFLIQRHTRDIKRAGLGGQAFVGEHIFKWETQWAYPWLGGWADNQAGVLRERNIVVVIPGRDRSQAVFMADHYDTAYMRDHFDREEGGDGARLAAPGSDDNCSATATLLLAAPVLLELSRQQKLDCDVWLVHLTGEEFPADGIGARRLCQDMIQGTFRLQLPDGKECDLSEVEVRGGYVLDMVAHRTGGERGVFQISPGTGRQALWLAELMHHANEVWNAWAPLWNRRARNRGRFKRSRDPRKPPAPARFPTMIGEVRPVHDPRSTLYNADSQTFSDSGVPIVLLMEDYDIAREGYHDSDDTMGNLDLDYGSALAAIAIESVVRASRDSFS